VVAKEANGLDGVAAVARAEAAARSKRVPPEVEEAGKTNSRKSLTRSSIMPAGDGTGPAGLGPMTGRAAGYCAGSPMPGYMNPMAARGWGMGRGWGRGRAWRNMFYATGLTG
jgi:hypothetical protein